MPIGTAWTKICHCTVWIKIGLNNSMVNLFLLFNSARNDKILFCLYKRDGQTPENRCAGRWRCSQDTTFRSASTVSERYIFFLVVTGEGRWSGSLLRLQKKHYPAQNFLSSFMNSVLWCDVKLETTLIAGVTLIPHTAFSRMMLWTLCNYVSSWRHSLSIQSSIPICTRE